MKIRLQASRLGAGLLCGLFTLLFTTITFAQPDLPNSYNVPEQALSVEDITGTLHGFSIFGDQPYDNAGKSVASGDINGDGYDDIIIGAFHADVGDSTDAGKTYVVFGSANGVDHELDLSTLDGTNGFTVNGVRMTSESGHSVSSGDINGDGYDDVIIGAWGEYVTNATGNTYVIWGKASGYSSSIDLKIDDANSFFTINGIDFQDRAGYSVASGDVNGDSYDDVIIAAQGSDPDSRNFAGETYIVYGKSSSFGTSFDLSSLDGSNGFTLEGIDSNDVSATTVSSGDVNGDGYDDVIIGAYQARPGGRAFAGEAYVYFGKAVADSANIILSDIDGTNGFQLNGHLANDLFGFHVRNGDINGDGYHDVFVLAFHADPNGQENAGKVYVIFGKASGFSSSIEVSALNGTDGFTLEGANAYDNAGYSLDAADINGDGFEDLFIGAQGATVNGKSAAGEMYVFFGKASGYDATFPLSSINGMNGFKITGNDYNQNIGSALAGGDVNGDGYNDVIIGAYQSNAGSDENAGVVHVFTNTRTQTITGSEGFRMLGTHMNGKVYDDVLSRFWTQGFTNSDAPPFGSNVWSWDAGNQQWTTLANQETDELATGTGFLMYMYTDDDNNGTDDGFPKTLSAPGSFTSLNSFDAIVNTGVQYIFNDLADTDFYLAANPYSKAIDWDAGTGWTKTNLSQTIYIWSDSASTWLTWNGVTGSKPNDGVLAAGQAFFVQASGGTGALYTQETVQTDNNSFYLKTQSEQPFVSFRLDANTENLSSSAFLTFTEQGLIARDPLDGMALTPLSDSFLQLGFEDASTRDVLSIQSLPLDEDQQYVLPLSLAGRNVAETAEFRLSETKNLDENWRIYIQDVESGVKTELTPNSSITLDIQAFAQKTSSFETGTMVTNLKGKNVNTRYQLIIETGTFTETEVSENRPTSFNLHQNYPNPFNPSTVIGYAIPEQTIVSLTVYDLLGRAVETLINNKAHAAGTYEVLFNASNLSSGTYIYQLKAGDMVFTKKLMLIK